MTTDRMANAGEMAAFARRMETLAHLGSGGGLGVQPRWDALDHSSRHAHESVYHRTAARSAPRPGDGGPGPSASPEDRMPDALAVAATAWGVVMGISPVLQIRRMLTTRSSADLSIGYLAVLMVGFALWIAYGLSIANPALVIANTVALVVGAVTILVAARLRVPRA